MAIDRSAPPEDPITARARASREAMQEAHRLEVAGDLHGALAIWEAYEAEGGARPVWLWSTLESLRRRNGDAPAADLALAAAAERALEAAGTGHGLTQADTIARVARQLVAVGRHGAAVQLMETARATLEDVIAGRQVSMSARVPAQVRDEIDAVLAELAAGERP